MNILSISGQKLAAEIEDNSLNTNSLACGDSSTSTDSNLFFKFSEINEDEVIHQLRSLKISKSTGLDNIPAKALKISADIVGSVINLDIQPFDQKKENMWMNGRKPGLYPFINLMTG